jgi:hypothetical protein
MFKFIKRIFNRKIYKHLDILEEMILKLNDWKAILDIFISDTINIVDGEGSRHVYEGKNVETLVNNICRKFTTDSKLLNML